MQTKEFVTRSYNSLAIKKGKLVKTCPKERCSKEIEWFREAANVIPEYIPKIYSTSQEEGQYEMQLISGSNFYEWLISNPRSVENEGKIFELVEIARNRMHLQDRSVVTEDLIQMYYHKPKQALAAFLAGDDGNSLIINGQALQNPMVALEEAWRQFKSKLFKTRFSFIHGDLTFSNTLIDDQGRLYFIDPRGGFGNTLLYGDVRYDVAKIYYSLVGNFDSLNAGRFECEPANVAQGEYGFQIATNGYENLGGEVVKAFGEEEPVIKYIHSTIWLSLLPHMANDPRQQQAAFCQGAKLINEVCYETSSK